MLHRDPARVGVKHDACGVGRGIARCDLRVYLCQVIPERCDSHLPGHQAGADRPDHGVHLTLGIGHLHRRRGPRHVPHIMLHAVVGQRQRAAEHFQLDPALEDRAAEHVHELPLHGVDVLPELNEADPRRAVARVRQVTAQHVVRQTEPAGDQPQLRCRVLGIAAGLGRVGELQGLAGRETLDGARLQTGGSGAIIRLRGAEGILVRRGDEARQECAGLLLQSAGPT